MMCDCAHSLPPPEQCARTPIQARCVRVCGTGAARSNRMPLSSAAPEFLDIVLTLGKVLCECLRRGQNKPGVNTSRLAEREKETQTEDRIRSVKMLSQSTQADCDEERIARRWLERNGLCAAESSVLVKRVFHHAMWCLQRPAGRADRGGSQQVAFYQHGAALPAILQQRQVSPAAVAFAAVPGAPAVALYGDRTSRAGL
eukprot:99114-Pleurochrysis_carterae.AAC.1